MPLLYIALILIIIVFASFVLPIIRGAIFLPTFPKTVEKMIKVAKLSPGQKAVDLGSGDGRILIALAKQGVYTHGYEINPFLVLISRYRIRKANLQKHAFVHWKSLWKADLTQMDAVFIFGISYIMKNLELKLKKELPEGAIVISNAFLFPSWKETKKDLDKNGALLIYKNTKNNL